MNLYCPRCRTWVRVVGTDERILDLLDPSLWPKGYPCVQFFCQGVVHQRVEGLEGKPIELTPEQCFRALHGGGLPEEVEPTAQLVRELCAREMVTCIEFEGGEKPILAALHLQTTVLHFAASPQGAVVFKLTKRQETDDGTEAT